MKRKMHFVAYFFGGRDIWCANQKTRVCGNEQYCFGVNCIFHLECVVQYSSCERYVQVAVEKGRIVMAIDIEKRKMELAVMLDELEADIKTLQDNIMKFRLALADVDENTDLKKFDDDYDVERGLNCIRLY